MNPRWVVIVLVLFLWSAANTWHQLDQASRFIRQGQRFTAQDGQALCERIAALETLGGMKPLPCHYPSEP